MRVFTSTRSCSFHKFGEGGYGGFWFLERKDEEDEEVERVFEKNLETKE